MRSCHASLGEKIKKKQEGLWNVQRDFSLSHAGQMFAEIFSSEQDVRPNHSKASQRLVSEKPEGALMQYLL